MAIFLAVGCTPGSAVTSRFFEPGRAASSSGPLEVQLTRVAYGATSVVVTVTLRNRGEQSMRHQGAGTTLEFEGLHYPANDPAVATVAPHTSSTVVLKYEVGRRLFAPARLVFRDLTSPGGSLSPLVIEVPEAPRPDEIQSGTGP
jgi:hypothetical protein